ncbi:MAG: VCBS repeat-containing protein [Oscillospiraceae bacterium]|jgi:hypothetical protein|nr:VCBS repeat-containing protein [Oscillospiraceae bacterium]
MRNIVIVNSEQITNNKYRALRGEGTSPTGGTGETTPRLRAYPSTEGIGFGRRTRPAGERRPATPVQPLSPLWRGAASAAGWFPPSRPQTSGYLPRRARQLLFVICSLLFVLLSSCGRAGADDLFVLPKQSEEYDQIQRVIDEELRAGATYSAPSGGNYRQSVQLRDIDGDGVNEAIAFFAVTAEQSLRIAIFSRDDDGTYKRVAVIDGDGSGVDSVYYPDMNGDGTLELIIGWKLGSDVKMLAMYSLIDFAPVQLGMADYTVYTLADLTGDGLDDIAAIRHDSANFGGVLTVYSLGKDGETTFYSAALSPTIENIQKLAVSPLSEASKTPLALFIEGGWQTTGLITDIFAFRGETLANISANPKTGISESTGRLANTTCRDINNNGVIDIPLPRVLPGAGETVFRALDWYEFNEAGRKTMVLSTFHNTPDGWYLILPTEGRDRVSMRREDKQGEHALICSWWDNGTAVDFLTIYTLSGENRAEIALRNNCFTIRVEDEVLYAGKILGFAGEITEAYIRENFKLIYTDWNNGI